MFRLALGLFAALVLHGASTCAIAAGPNILFLFADDMSFEAIGALGHTDIETPNLDRLARRGTTFTHAYNMGSWSGAVCVASRTMLITGRSLWHANDVYNTTDKERVAGRLWPQMMSRAGYDTYFTGKWHIQTDAAKTFDVAKHIRGGMPKDTPEAYNRPLSDKPDPWSPSDPKFGGFWEGGKHWSEVVADDTIEFLTAAKQSEKPFFIYAAFNAPHDPRQSPAEYIEKYPLDRINVPKNFLPEYPYKDDIGCAHKSRDEYLAPMPRTEHAVKVHRQEYYAAITHLDAQIGRILAALEQSGAAENTWIFFTADHGLAIGHHGLFGKQNMYEHSLRVPFIVVGPEAKPGAQIDAPIYLQDAMATSLALAGMAKPEQVEFQSLLPLLRGESSPAAREAIYGGYLALQRAVVHNGWKLIAYPQAKVVRLYHLEDDPLEMHDLAALQQFEQRKRKLFAQLIRLQKSYDDRLDLLAAFPDFAAAK
jgi:choline-sulfatase